MVHDPLNQLPSEIWDAIIDALTAHGPQHAVKLISLRHSFTGRRVRYHFALWLHGLLPLPTNIPADADRLASTLFESRWPPNPQACTVTALEPHISHRHFAVHDQHTCGLDQTVEVQLSASRIYAIAPDLKSLVVSKVEHNGQVTLEKRLPLPDQSLQGIHRFALDDASQIVLLQAISEVRNDTYDVSLFLVDLVTGMPLASEPIRFHLWPEDHEDLELQLVGDQILILSRSHIVLLRWIRPSHAAALVPDKLECKITFRRWWTDPESSRVVTAATLINHECLALVLNEIGVDRVGEPWQSQAGILYLELLKLSSFGDESTDLAVEDALQAFLVDDFDGRWTYHAEIVLPGQSMVDPLRGNYIKIGLEPAALAGLGDADSDLNCLVVVRASGNPWIMELRSLAELLYPRAALTIYSGGGPRWPTLGHEWCKANMVDTLMDHFKSPVSSLSVRGWRAVAAVRVEPEREEDRAAGSPPYLELRCIDWNPNYTHRVDPSMRLKKNDFRDAAKRGAMLRETGRDRPVLITKHPLWDTLPFRPIDRHPHTDVRADAAWFRIALDPTTGILVQRIAEIASDEDVARGGRIRADDDDDVEDEEEMLRSEIFILHV
ncbi:uncharacterized protein PSFLO_07104 [Pseudozyma flocculosa]|uniref:Uncharacterized protein n=1 Tax=Pseudozyma flocculosa TaxID=84751 RepID=A0A5C3FB76_9BASI|nr:uncharacterized protein PSFLO_07104 [Pseudozyma flocculosa]